MKWVMENKEWLFSGVGLTLLAFIGYILSFRFRKKQQTITSGDNSNNVQGNRDVNVTIGDKNARR